MRTGAFVRRLRTVASPLLALAVALAAVSTYGYLRGAYVTAIVLGVGAILTSLFVVLTRR